MFNIDPTEQEQVYNWLKRDTVLPPTDEESVLNWLTSIGSGAAQGATTGAVAGPWGALIGGLVGAGLGAAQQALQPAQQQGSRPTPVVSPPSMSTRPSSSSSSSQSLPPPNPAATGSQRDAKGAVPQASLQQTAQILPQLLQLVQSLQPIISSIQQGGGQAREDIIEGPEETPLAGDKVPDTDFTNETITQINEYETGENEDHIEPSKAQTISTDPQSFNTPFSWPTLSQPTNGSYLFDFPAEWLAESESVSSIDFHWDI